MEKRKLFAALLVVFAVNIALIGVLRTAPDAYAIGAITAAPWTGSMAPAPRRR